MTKELDKTLPYMHSPKRIYRSYGTAFADKLKLLRKGICNLTIRELSIKTGIDSRSLETYESIEHPTRPGFYNMIALAKALDISVDYLLGISDDSAE